MHLLELVAMLGAAQGVLLLLLIGFRYRHRKNIPFALLLVAFAVRLGTIPSWRPEVLLQHPWILTIVGPLPLLFGFLVWWYVRELMLEHPHPPPLFALHLLPWLLETILLSLHIYPLSPEEYRVLVAELFTTPAPWWMTVRHIAKGVVGAVYAFAAARLAFSRSRAPVPAMRRHFARVVILMPFLAMVAFSVVALQPELTADSTAVAATRFSPFYLPALAMMAAIYAFALAVLIAPGVLADDPVSGNAGGGEFERGCEPEPLSFLPSLPARPEADDPVRGCPDDPPELLIPVEEITRMARLVEQRLVEEVFRDPELSLSDLAISIGVHPNRLSFVINHAFGENFCNVLHRYRLDWFVRRASEGALRERTILELAFEAGFSSKSTFNRVFKERFRCSPSQYTFTDRSGSVQVEGRKPASRRGESVPSGDD